MTDRTTLDNLAYEMLHDVHSIDGAEMDKAVGGFYRYTHVIYCPVKVFCKVGDDEARVKNRTYQMLFDVVVEALVQRAWKEPMKLLAVYSADLPTRLQRIEMFLGSAP